MGKAVFGMNILRSVESVCAHACGRGGIWQSIPACLPSELTEDLGPGDVYLSVRQAPWLPVTTSTNTAMPSSHWQCCAVAVLIVVFCGFSSRRRGTLVTEHCRWRLARPVECVNWLLPLRRQSAGETLVLRSSLADPFLLVGLLTFPPASSNVIWKHLALFMLEDASEDPAAYIYSIIFCSDKSVTF